MSNIRNGHSQSTEIESLIFAARDYVRPSDDLRPRVLEIARLEHRERRLQQRLAQMAAVVLLMVTVITVWHQPDTADRANVFLPTVQVMSTESSLEATRSGDHATWETVESFTDLRRQQADLLRL